MKKNNAWNIRRMVNVSFIPATQWASVLYWRLSDFKSLYISLDKWPLICRSAGNPHSIRREWNYALKNGKFHKAPWIYLGRICKLYSHGSPICCSCYLTNGQEIYVQFSVSTKRIKKRYELKSPIKIWIS